MENVEVWGVGRMHRSLGYYPGGSQGNVFPRPSVVFRADGLGRCADPADVAPFGFALPGSAATLDAAEGAVTDETEPENADRTTDAREPYAEK